MRCPVAWLGALALFLALPAGAVDTDFDVRVQRVLARTPLFDLHIVLPWDIR